MPTEQQIKSHIREMVEAANTEPALRQVIRDRGVIPAVEERVQQAFELRDLLQTFPERIRKEAMIAGDLYQPSRKERVLWGIQDRVSAWRNKIFGVEVTALPTAEPAVPLNAEQRELALALAAITEPKHPGILKSMEESLGSTQNPGEFEEMIKDMEEDGL